MRVDTYKLLHKGIWIYFYLLIFEGALRKWILPDLSSILLLIRDPLALVLLFLGFRARLLKNNYYWIICVFIGFISLITTFLTGHGNLLVALYGLRTMLLHFPLIFIIGKVFSKKDVIQLGKHVLWMSIPVLILVILQFYSPQNVWVNRGVGGDLEGAGFSGALGYFRPPGTFSFTTGNVSFFSLVGVFVFYFWTAQKEINKLLLLTATAAFFISIPFSISRTLMFQTVIIILFLIIATFRDSKVAGNLIVGGIFVSIFIIVFSDLPFVNTAIEVITTRFTNASRSEGGIEGTLVDRFLGSLFGAATNKETPFFGYGLGMASQVGAKLLTGDTGFLLAEIEWGRIVSTMGLLIGMMYIIVRGILVVDIGLSAYKQSTSFKNHLPWLLFSYASYLVLFGQWAQATMLGFVTITTGLVLASIEKP